MKISVIMPVYNNVKYLKESIDSVLGQTFDDFEFIILDDASEEPVSDLVKTYNDFRIVLNRNKKNLGLTKSLNICLDMAKGDIIARQDGDDISMPTRFEKQIKIFDDHDGIVSTYGESIDINSKIREGHNRFMHEWLKRDPNEIKKDMLNGGRSMILGPSAMYSKEVFNKVGYYDEKFTFSQDYNYWLRVLQFFDLKVVDEVLYHHRCHSETSRKKMPERYGNLSGKERLALIQNRAKKYAIIKNKGDYCE